MIGNKTEIIGFKCEGGGCDKAILDVVIDVDNEKDEETILAMIAAYITHQPQESTLTMVELNDIPISDPSIVLLAKHFKATEQYVRKTAIIPNDTYLRAFLIELNKTRDKKFGIFKDKKEAMEWLVSKNPEEIDEFTTII